MAHYINYSSVSVKGFTLSFGKKREIKNRNEFSSLMLGPSTQGGGRCSVPSG